MNISYKLQNIFISRYKSAYFMGFLLFSGNNLWSCGNLWKKQWHMSGSSEVLQWTSTLRRIMRLTLNSWTIAVNLKKCQLVLPDVMNLHGTRKYHSAVAGVISVGCLNRNRGDANEEKEGVVFFYFFITFGWMIQLPRTTKLIIDSKSMIYWDVRNQLCVYITLVN